MSLASDLQYLWRSYRNASVWTRLHVCGRRVTCPFDEIEQEIPSTGVHLDVGCGHGALLALMHRRCRNRSLIGIDVSSTKIGQAHLAELEGINLKVGSITKVPPGSVDSLSLVDVLYLVPIEEREHFIKAVASVLKPGGCLILKETTKRPVWKYAILFLQEFIAVRVLKFTQGSTIQIPSVQDIEQLLIKTGFMLPVIKFLDRGYPHPHVCFTTQLCSAAN